MAPDHLANAARGYSLVEKDGETGSIVRISQIRGRYLKQGKNQ